MCSQILIHCDLRSASDQTPGGQSKVLRGRLQTEDQVRRLSGVTSFEEIYNAAQCLAILAQSQMKQWKLQLLNSSTSESLIGNFQENLVAPSLVIARKHSLRSDALMSPHKVSNSILRPIFADCEFFVFQVVDYGPMQRVKRVHSDRSPMARYIFT